MEERPPKWRLPAGVGPELWDYLNDSEAARHYDAGLVGTHLLDVDQQFVQRHCEQPGRVLDMGCGTGRLLIRLAQQGPWVLGVALSEPMLAAVGEKAAKTSLVIHRLKANIVELGSLADGSFDYVACLFSTLGMVSGTAERRRVIEHVRRLLRPGGTFIVHVHNYWFNCWDRG